MQVYLAVQESDLRAATRDVLLNFIRAKRSTKARLKKKTLLLLLLLLKRRNKSDIKPS